MHSEFCMISGNCGYHQRNKAGGQTDRLCRYDILRTLESLTDESSYFHETSAWTDIFIYPGYKFKAMNALVQTSICRKAARHARLHICRPRKDPECHSIAVRERYRFFSFGDAMFIYYKVEVTMFKVIKTEVLPAEEFSCP